MEQRKQIVRIPSGQEIGLPTLAKEGVEIGICGCNGRYLVW